MITVGDKLRALTKTSVINVSFFSVSLPSVLMSIVDDSGCLSDDFSSRTVLASVISAEGLHVIIGNL